MAVVFWARRRMKRVMIVLEYSVITRSLLVFYWILITYYLLRVSFLERVS